jgi:hypothetical protein
MPKAVELKREKYTVQVKYSPEAIEKKLMKFITPSGDEFEVSAEEMSTMLMGQVNNNLLEATFVESDRVNVVEVTRQIAVKVNRDIKSGEKVMLEYRHPYPVEFAVIEQAMKLAKIEIDVPVFTLTKEYLDEVLKKTTPEQKTFINRFYEFFKSLKIRNK